MHVTNITRTEKDGACAHSLLRALHSSTPQVV